MLGARGAATIPSSSTSAGSIHLQGINSMSSHLLLHSLVSAAPQVKNLSLRPCERFQPPPVPCKSRARKTAIFSRLPSFRHFSPPSYAASPGQEVAMRDGRETSSSSAQSSIQAARQSTSARDGESLCLRRFAFLRRTGVASAGGGAVFGSSFAALAEAVEEQAVSGEAQPTDQVLSVLFTAAFIGLSVLTIGVIYLSVSDFLENRRLSAMQKEIAEEVKESDKNEKVRVGNRKGFGVPRTEKKAEKK